MRPLFLLLLALSACTPHDDFDFDTCGVRPRYVLPLAFRAGQPIVQGSIGGKPAEFILDTGATTILLTEAAAERLGVPVNQRQVVTSQGMGGAVRSFAATLRDLKIGQIEVPDHQIRMIREFPDSSGLAGVAGLFGASVLHIFEVELDFAHAKATLHAGRLCPQTVIPPWNFGFSTISAEGSRDGRFLIPVELDGRRIIALIDTGSTQTVVARDIAAALGATDERLARGPQGRVVGVGGSVASAGYAFRSLRIGDETYGAPELIVAPRAEPGIDIILGSDFLARHRIWLSYARRRVFIEYGPRPSRP